MRTIPVYRSYAFNGKDPIVGKLDAIVKASGRSYSEIHERSGVSKTSLYNWFNGATKRPQFATVNAVARALGKELVFAKLKGAKQ